MSYSHNGRRSQCGIPAPAFLMIDVEGSATEVIRGTYKNFEPGPRLVCEIHDGEERDGVIRARWPKRSM